MSVALTVMGIAQLLRVFIAVGILVGCQSCRSNIGGFVLIGHRECRALSQELLPFIFLVGVLLVCAQHCSLLDAAPASPAHGLTLDCGVGVTGVAPHWSRSFIVLGHAW
jgi:hypothetical protein